MFDFPVMSIIYLLNIEYCSTDDTNQKFTKPCFPQENNRIFPLALKIITENKLCEQQKFRILTCFFIMVIFTDEHTFMNSVD